MDYGEILGTTWKIVWKQKVLFGFGLVSMIAPIIMGLLMGGFFIFFDPMTLEHSLGDFLGVIGIALIGGYLLFIAFSFVLHAIGTAGVLNGTMQAEGGAETLSFIELWDGIWPYVGRVMAFMFVFGLGMVILFMFPALLGVLTAGLFFLCMVPLMIIFIPLGILGYLFMSLGVAVVVADGLSVVDTFKQTWETIRRNFWPLVLVTVILYLVLMAVGMAISLPMSFLQGVIMVPIMNNADPLMFMRIFGIMLAIMLPFSFLLQGLAMTYVNAGWMVTYLRLKAKTPFDPDTPIQLETA